jgi:bifunctional DNase/RNase
MVEVKVQSIQVSLMTDHRVVLLKEVDSERVLPIWIGTHEAEAIAIRMRGVQVARPMTHDLLGNMIAGLGGQVLRITVNALRDDTFYALITVRVDGHDVEIDSRPSDAIALAVRAEVPIFVEDSVMSQAGIVPDVDVSMEADEEDLKAFRAFIDSLDLDDLPLQ